MKNEIIRFIASSAIYLAGLILIGLIVDFVGVKAVLNMPNYSGQIAKDNYRISRVRKDIILIGSSRCNHHYVTTMLGDSINNYLGKNYSIYNAGIDGKFINSNLCATECLIERYMPKLLVIEIGERELKRKNLSRDLEFSAHHYHTNEIVRNYLDSLGWKERLKMHSSLYRYNDKLFKIAYSYVIDGDSTGYEPLCGVMKIKNGNKKLAKEEVATVNKYSEMNLRRVLEKCRDKNINVILVSSPRYCPTDNNYYLHNICCEYGLPHIDLYDLDDFNNHPEWFKDGAHLNDEGAHVYTNLFFQQIKCYLDKI